MTRQEIIKALKENTSAFGLMGKDAAERKELHKTMQQIGFSQFEPFGCSSLSYDFNAHLTYRLRADYQDEPEYEKWEVVCANWLSGLRINYGKKTVIGMPITDCPHCPNFSHFETESGAKIHLEDVATSIRNGNKVYAVFVKE